MAQHVYSLGEYNGDCIIEYALSKHQHVEGWVNFEGMEDSQSGHRVHSRNEGAKCKANEEKKQTYTTTVHVHVLVHVYTVCIVIHNNIIKQVVQYVRTCTCMHVYMYISTGTCIQVGTHRLR